RRCGALQGFDGGGHPRSLAAVPRDLGLCRVRHLPAGGDPAALRRPVTRRHRALLRRLRCVAAGRGSSAAVVGFREPRRGAPRGVSYPIVVLVSGEGTNLQAILDSVHGNEVEVVGVAASRAEARGLDRARAAGVATAVFAITEYEDRGARDAALADWIEGLGA